MSYSPYAPPQAGPSILASYRPTGWKTMAAGLSIVGSVAFTALSAVLTLTVGAKLAGNLVAVLLIGLVSLLGQVLSLAAAVLFLMWIHNVALNVRAFGKQGLAFTPGWCVGWWFIPVASLWKPYQAMKELWRASDPDALDPAAPEAWRASRVPALFPLWWATYLGSGVVALVGACVDVFSTLETGKPPATGAAELVLSGLVASVFSGASAIVVYLVMRDLAVRQEICAERLGLGSGSGR